MHVCVGFEERPVQPAYLVVLAVGIVVAELRLTDFVSHEYHRDTQREDRDDQEVLDLAIAQSFHLGVLGWTFNAAVPAAIVVSAVAIAFAVRVIVLRVVADEIVESEAIVAGYEIDALLRLALLMSIDFGTAKDAVRNAPH